MAVRDLGLNMAELAWLVAFQPNSLPVSKAMDLLAGGLAEN